MRILLIDDDEASRNSLAKFLRDNLRHEVICEASCDAGLARLSETEFPLIITDIKMQGTDGLSFLKKVKSETSTCKSEVVLITGHACLDDAIEALRLGANDYLLKPLDIRQLAKIIERIIPPQQQPVEETDTKQCEEDKSEKIAKNIIEIKGIGRAGFFSEAMHKVRDFAVKLHCHREIPVLIEGETGTGKEIIARLIHGGQEMEKRPFVSLNCASISANLFESELFGYARGAFTGADPKGKPGKLELAQGGTLFLDEIADMPCDIQPKLLRVLQEREFYRVAGSKKIKLDIRVIAATNQDLQEMVANKQFRSDLYYRLSTAKIVIPPLRERKKDITGLAMMFLQEQNESQNKTRQFSETAKEILTTQYWQGNVRELFSVIERVLLKYNDNHLRGAYIEEVLELNTGIFNNVFQVELPETEMSLWDIEKQIAQKVLRFKNNNISQAARYLHISRNKLKRLLSD